MKRINNLFQQIISIENLQLADERARKGKSKRYGVILHDKNRENNILWLHESLKNKKYFTSPYKIFTIYEPKERIISSLPFRDRIVHHAIMNILEPIFVSTFTADTYSCIKGRGIHAGKKAVEKALQDKANTHYCLKMDIKKFYPNIDHAILKQLLRKKFKDLDLLWLLDEIIDSSPGVPIGNYLSQFFANFYLTYLDHYLKATYDIDYFRYLDDMVILHKCKKYLHKILADVKRYLQEKLNLILKKNYQVFLISARGIDFLGYVFRHGYTRVRKGIKKNFARSVAKNKSQASIAAYLGWLMHADCNHLRKKLLHGKL